MRIEECTPGKVFTVPRYCSTPENLASFSDWERDNYSALALHYSDITLGPGAEGLGIREFSQHEYTRELGRRKLHS